MEEVIVTAQKREENIQDVAISVTALTDRTITALGLTKNVDIAAQTPGLLFAEGSEQLITVSSIRGVSQNDLGFHLEPPNAVYMDQAYVSVLSAANFEMFDLERVEVLKGPQGSLFGRNATGGLLHFVTRAPSAESDGYADVQLGEKSQIRVEGAIGGSLGNNVSGRLSLLHDSYNGFMTNTTLHRDFRGRDETGVRAQLQFDPNDDVSIRLIGFYGDQETDLAYKHSAVGVNEDGLLFSLPRDVNFWGTCPGCDPSGHRESSTDPFSGEQDTAGFFESETRYFTGIIEWHINDMTLTSVTNFLDYEASHREDGEMSPRPGFDLVSGQDSSHVTQELRLSGAGQRSRWIAGLYFIHREAKSSQNAIVNLQYFDDVLSTFGVITPGDVAMFGTTDNLVSNWRMNTSSRAAFGQVEYDINPAWMLVVGARYTDDDLDFNFASVESIDGIPIGPGGLLGQTQATDTSGESDWSGRLALQWHPNEQWMTYLSYSRGTKSGGWNAPFLGGEVTEFSGETLNSLEAGFKGTLMNGRARLSAAAFTYDYQDYQGFTFVDLAARVSNVDAVVNGLEAEFHAASRSGWDIGLGISVLDTKIQNVVLPSLRVTDREMPLAPDTTFNAMLTKRWSTFGGQFSLTLDYAWLDDHFAEALNNPSGLIESYGIANARLSFLTGDGHWEFGVIVRNLADERYLVYRTPIDLGFNQDHYGRPRWVSGQIRYFW
jgi:iron complex outermembrane receptor protein